MTNKEQLENRTNSAADSLVGVLRLDGKRPAGYIPLCRVKNYIDQVAPNTGEQRYTALLGAGTHLRDNFKISGEILAYWLVQLNQTKCMPSLEIDELQKICGTIESTDSPDYKTHMSLYEGSQANAPQADVAQNLDDNFDIIAEQFFSTLLRLFASHPECFNGAFNTSFAPVQTEITADNAMDFFRYDHTPIKFSGGHCKGENFEYATAVPFDMDNDDADNPEKWDNPTNWVSPDTIANRLKALGIIFWMAASRNHQLPKEKNGQMRPARPKFHVYLPLSVPLYDCDQYVRYCEWCIKTFNSDPQIKSKAQKLFGYGSNSNAFVLTWNEGRCVDEVLNDDDLVAVVAVPSSTKQKQCTPVASAARSSRRGNSHFDWFVESGVWREHLADLAALGWVFLDENDDGQLFFQTPDGDHTHGKHDGNIKEGVAYFFSRAPEPFEDDKRYSICQLFAGALFGDIGKAGIAKFAKRYLSGTILSKGWQPFPVEVLPAKTRRFVQEAAKANSVDPALIGPAVLSVFSGIIGRCCKIELKKGFVELPSIWVMIIALSGSRKTPAFNAVLAPVREHQARMDENFKQELREYEATRGRTRDKETDSPAPAAPIPKQILIDEITIEAAAEVMEQNPFGVCLCQDEFSSFLGGFDAYRPNGGKDLPFWLSAFNGTPSRINRKTGRKLIAVPTPAVSICGYIQDGMLYKILAKNEHFFESGLMARFLAINPPELQEVWSEEEVSAATEYAYKCLVQRLINLRISTPCTPSNPIIVKLSAEAKTRWIEFYNANAAEKDEIIHDAGRAVWAKIPGYTARLALVLHVVEYLESDACPQSGEYHIPTEVSLHTLNAAIQLIEWFGVESMNVVAKFQRQSGNVDREAAAIINAVGRKGETTKAKLHNLRIFRDLPNAATVIDAKLVELKGRGILQSSSVGNPKGGIVKRFTN